MSSLEDGRAGKYRDWCPYKTELGIKNRIYQDNVVDGPSVVAARSGELSDEIKVVG